MQKYILSGEAKEVAKVIQENRIRVERGVIILTPVQPETVLDDDSLTTIREDLATKTEMCAKMVADQITLATLTDELIAYAVENGLAIPENLVEKFVNFGITVPQIAEIVPNDTEITDNAGESVTEPVLNDSDPVEDNKIIEAEDMTEVNLDDVKDIDVSDSKDAPAPTPKKTRSKKSE